MSFKFLKCSPILLALLLAMPQPGHAVIIALHNGSNSPVLSGWTSTGGLSEISVSSNKIAGKGTWTIDDFGTAAGTTRGYLITPTTEERDLGETHGWQFTTIVMPIGESDAPGASIHTEYAIGNKRWGLSFGTDNSGDPIVLTSNGDRYTLDGEGNTFHEFSVRKDPGNSSASLLVDGEVLNSNYVGQNLAQQRFIWGASSSADTGIGSYRRVMLEIFPPVDNYLVESYPLDGNATDPQSSTSNTVQNASPTMDRNGQNGSALLFDGPGDRVILDNSTFVPEQRFTLSAWVRPDDAVPGELRRILSRWDGSYAGLEKGAVVLETYTHLDETKPRVRFTIYKADESPVTLTSTRKLDVSEWHHLAVRMINGHMDLFINGEHAGEASLRANLVEPSSFNWGIGSDGSGDPESNENFRGAIDEVRFYNAALSDSEIVEAFKENTNVVASTSIAPGATGVSVDSDITLTVESSVDVSSVTSETVTVQASLSGEIPATVNAAAGTIAVSPNQPFKLGEVVEVSLSSSITSTSGYALVPYRFQFQTEIPETETLYMQESRSRSDSITGSLVDAAVGAVVHEMKTLTVESVRPMGIPLRYNSLLDRRKGAFGYGWSHPFEAHLEVKDNGDILVYYDKNRCNLFRETETPGTYRSTEEAAQYDLLRELPGPAPYNRYGKWTLTRKSGGRYIFGHRGQIIAMANRINQYVEAVYEDTVLHGVQDPASGWRIEFNYDYETGLIESMNDIYLPGEGPYRHAFFEYDDHGRLTGIHEPVIVNERIAGEPFSAKAIPDNDNDGLVHEIEVTDPSAVGVVTVNSASIVHGRHQDLEVYLESPSGTRVNIHQNQPGSGTLNLSGTRLFDFNGESPMGIWKVIVNDSGSGEFGTLNSWFMQFSSPTNPVYYSYAEAGLSPAGSSQLLSGWDGLGNPFFSNEYDEQRRVIRQDDGVDTNQVATFTYDFSSPNERKTTYTNRTGDSSSFVHDSSLRILSFEDALGGITRWTYTGKGQVRSVTNAIDQTTSFTYNDDGYMASSRDNVGGVLLFEHDQYGNVTEIKDSMDYTTSFQMDTSRNSILKVTDARGGQTNKKYGAYNVLIENLIEDGGGVAYTWKNGVIESVDHMQVGNVTAQVAYDPAGRPLIMTDGDGFQTKIKYRANGDVVEKTDPLGGVRRNYYDHRSRIIEEVDRKGNRTLYEYDNNDNLIQITDKDDRVFKLFYDGEDRLVRDEDPEGRSITYSYDVVGRQTGVTNPQGQKTTMTYDAIGNQLTVTDYKGLVLQRTVYNERNQPTRITGPYGNTSVITYDSLGRQTAVTDAAGRTTEYTYDELDRLVRVTDPSGHVYEQEYLADDMLYWFREPGGEQTYFSYDQANRLIGVSNAYYSPGSSTYNGRDSITTLRLPSGDALRMVYDDGGRVTQMQEINGNDFSNPVRRRNYEYDSEDNVTEISAPSSAEGSNSRTYDELNRITTYTDLNSNTIGYAYNDQGIMRRLTYPDGKTVEYFYDDLDRLERVLDWAGRETSYAYNELNQIELIVFPNNATRTMTYDEAGRLQSRADFDSAGSVIVEYTYTFNESSNIIVENISHEVPPYQPADVEMSYSSGNRLSTYNGMAVTISTEGTMVAGPLNGSSATFDYDIVGNMKRAGDISYQYDFEDRLIGWTQGSDTTTLTVNPAAGLSQILEKQAPDNSMTRYVYGVGLLYEDTPEGLRVFHYDERGNTTALSDASGVVSGRIAYGPYGEVYDRSGITDTIFLQNGLFNVITDPQGLCYMRYRWYSPEIKRFLTQDAHFGNIAQLGSLNRFAYAGGNPISQIDPDGELFILVPILVGAAISTGVELVVDLADGNGLDHSIGDYAAAAIGGGITGAVVAFCPTCIVAGEAIGAGVTNIAAAGFNGEQVDWGSFAADVVIAGAAGKLAKAGRGGSRLASKAGSKNAARVAQKAGKGRLAGEFFQADSSKYKIIVRNAPPINVTPKSTTIRNFASELGSIGKNLGLDLAVGTAQAYASKGLEFAIDFTIENPEQVFPPGSERFILDPRFQSSGGSTMGNLGVLYQSRVEQIQGRRGIYGEFNHWMLYVGSLQYAREPVPVEMGRQLTTF